MQKLLSIFFIAAFSCTVSAEDAKPLRVLHLTGGCCHDYTKQKVILSEGITARANTEFDIVHEGGTGGDYKYPLLQTEGWGKNFDVVLYNICFAHIKDDAYVEGITKVHHEGLPAVALHCTYHSHHWQTKTKEWQKFLGVTSPNHGKHHAITIKNLKPEHPIMKNFPAEWTTPKGELYRENKTWDTATPLALGTADQEKHHCVWINEYGAARVFGTTIGHHNETMESKEYLDLVAAGLLWVSGKLGDDGKPLEGYGPKK